jgi:hypothetical protein
MHVTSRLADVGTNHLRRGTAPNKRGRAQIAGARSGRPPERLLVGYVPEGMKGRR